MKLLKILILIGILLMTGTFAYADDPPHQTGLQNIINMVNQFVKNVFNFFKKVVSNTGGALGKFKKFLSNLVKNTFGTLKGLMAKLIKFFKIALAKLISLIRQIFSKFNNIKFGQYDYRSFKMTQHYPPVIDHYYLRG